MIRSSPIDLALFSWNLRFLAENDIGSDREWNRGIILRRSGRGRSDGREDFG